MFFSRGLQSKRFLEIQNFGGFKFVREKTCATVICMYYIDLFAHHRAFLFVGVILNIVYVTT